MSNTNNENPENLDPNFATYINKVKKDLEGQIAIEYYKGFGIGPNGEVFKYTVTKDTEPGSANVFLLEHSPVEFFNELLNDLPERLQLLERLLDFSNLQIQKHLENVTLQRLEPQVLKSFLAELRLDSYNWIKLDKPLNLENWAILHQLILGEGFFFMKDFFSILEYCVKKDADYINKLGDDRAALVRTNIHTVRNLVSSYYIGVYKFNLTEGDVKNRVEAHKNFLSAFRGLFEITLAINSYLTTPELIYIPFQSEHSIKKFIKAVAEIFSTEVLETKINLNGVSEQLMISNSKLAMGQIIINLLTNAIKYSFDPSIGANQDTKPVLLSVKNDSGNVTIEIFDDGLSISPEDIDRILNGQQIHKDQYPNIESSGTGINTVNRLLAQLGGTLQIILGPENGYNKLFRVKIPTDSIISLESES